MFRRWTRLSQSKCSSENAGNSHSTVQETYSPCVGKRWGKGRKWENTFVNSLIIHFHTQTPMHGSTPQKCVDVRCRLTFSNHLQTFLDERQHWIPTHRHECWYIFNSKPLLLSRIRTIQWLMDQPNWLEKQNLNSWKRTQCPPWPTPQSHSVRPSRLWLPLSRVQETHLSPHNTASKGEATSWARIAAVRQRNSPSLPLLLPPLASPIPPPILRCWIISLCYLPGSTPWAPVFKHSENVTAWKFLLSVRWGHR